MISRRTRTLILTAGVAVAVIAVAPPVDDVADRTLAAHMAQHMLLTLVAAPLIVIGSPVALALRISSRRARRWTVAAGHGRLARAVTAPLLGWLLLPIVQAAVYATPLLRLSAEDELLHAAVHAALLFSALLFWRPIVGTDPARRLPPPAQVGYLLAAMPASDVIGIWLIASGSVHYPPSVTTGIADQRRAGVVMLAGSAILGIAALRTAWGWVERDHLRTLAREQFR